MQDSFHQPSLWSWWTVGERPTFSETHKNPGPEDVGSSALSPGPNQGEERPESSWWCMGRTIYLALFWWIFRQMFKQNSFPISRASFTEFNRNVHFVSFRVVTLVVPGSKAQPKPSPKPPFKKLRWLKLSVWSTRFVVFSGAGEKCWIFYMLHEWFQIMNYKLLNKSYLHLWK